MKRHPRSHPYDASGRQPSEPRPHRRPAGVDPGELTEESHPTYHAIEEAKRHALEDLYFPGPRPGRTRSAPLPPGSDEAVEAGCSCPRIDNAYGLGFRRFQSDPDPETFAISAGCALHGYRVHGLHGRP